jgi:protein TonB
MKTSSKDLGFVDQCKTELNRSHKHDANLQKNTALYFQIGLILSLLATYALFEMQFEKRIITITDLDYTEDTTIEVATVYRTKPQEPVKPKPREKVAKTLTDTYEPVDNGLATIETKLLAPDAKDPFEPLKPNSLPKIEEPEEPIEDVFIGAVQVVPIFPGCEKYTTNEERKKCMSTKIGKLVSKNFRAELGTKYGIKGEQRLYSQFTISSEGKVTNVKVRGPHPALEKEAERVILKIPKMQPGYQGNKAVGVIYTLPIYFFVN